MKEAFSCGWVTKVGGAVLVSLLALPTHAQLMLAHEGHHDAGGCVINTGEFPVAFSAYEVPDNDLPPLHAFCKNIPNPGKVNLTVELSDWDSREILLAARLLKVGHEGHEAAHGDTAAHSQVDSKEVAGHDMGEHDEHAGHGETAHKVSEHGIVYMPPQQHRSGIIVMSANLPEKGDYEILLERHDDAGKVTVAARVPFSVGGSGGHGGHGGGLGTLEIIMLLGAIGGGAFYYMYQRKKSAEGVSDKS
ncbi:MAG: hypothetical protein Q8K59_12080 [Nitrosomonas sp.]|nr:hypothetical protein [Nitrosomonas sp.]MDP1951802.1 hypothetical protein [Nitrosomonas sp.]